jgi:hypothetical protein
LYFELFYLSVLYAIENKHKSHAPSGLQLHKRNTDIQLKLMSIIIDRIST